MGATKKMGLRDDSEQLQGVKSSITLTPCIVMLDTQEYYLIFIDLKYNPASKFLFVQGILDQFVAVNFKYRLLALILFRNCSHNLFFA